MKAVHDSAFSRVRTKAEAIVKNFFAKLAMKNLKCDLKKASFISMHCDASNHCPIKLFPILIRHFLEEQDMCVKVLQVENLRCETADSITSYLLNTLKQFDLPPKLLGF